MMQFSSEADTNLSGGGNLQWKGGYGCNSFKINLNIESGNCSLQLHHGLNLGKKTLVVKTEFDITTVEDALFKE